MSSRSVIEAGMREYYDRRAAEYDDWWLGRGLHAARERPGWDAEVRELVAVVGALPPARVLDVACGTAFLTRHLRGRVTALDQSPAMAEIARARLPDARVVVGDAVPLPFPDGAFDRVFTGHFYGHLDVRERTAFLAEARRVAGELVVVDSALRDGVDPEEWQERELRDGSRHRVYKRYLTAAGLVEELGGGEPLIEGRWFVVVRSPAECAPAGRTRGTAPVS
jgi:demethylmenaquinone methyltransferase/2-methoxy-6-polyprenyl-1,4-benzoquinol methylase